MTDTLINLEAATTRPRMKTRASSGWTALQLMATLSEASDTPAGNHAPSAMLSSAAVDFGSRRLGSNSGPTSKDGCFDDDFRPTSIGCIPRISPRVPGLPPADAFDPSVQPGLTARALERLNERLGCRRPAARRLPAGTQRPRAPASTRRRRRGPMAESLGDGDAVSPEPVAAKADV